MSDPYTVLGVSPNASDDEISKAYRAAARKYHPDLHPGDKAAEAKMKEVNAAYEEIQARRSGKSTSNAGSGGAYYGGGNPYGQSGSQQTGGYRTYYYTYRPGGGQQPPPNGQNFDPFNFFSARPGGIFRIPFVRILLIIFIIRLILNLLFSIANPYRYGYYYTPTYPNSGYSTYDDGTQSGAGRTDNG